MALSACGSSGRDDPMDSDAGLDVDAGPDAGPAEVDAGPDRLPDGSPCEADDDCETRLCAAGDDGALTCLVPCSTPRACGVGSVCVLTTRDEDGTPGDDTWIASCRRGDPDDDERGAFCTRSDSCQSGLCLDRQCTVPCENDDGCLPGQVCRETQPDPEVPGSVRVCDYPALSGDGPEIQRVPILMETVPVSEPQPLIPVGVAPDAVSVTFVMSRPLEDAGTLAFTQARSPTGTVVLDFAQILTFIDQPLRWLASPLQEEVALVIPNTTSDRLNFLPGRWSVAPLVFGSLDNPPVPIEVVAEIKRAPQGIVDDGVLDLDIYLVGIGLSPDDAPDHPILAPSITRAQELFDVVGIRLGDIRYREIPGEDGERLSVIDSAGNGNSELAELFRFGTGPGRRLDVFLVRDLVDRSSITLGIAGDLPGPPSHGAGTSGVALVFDPEGSDADDIGRVLAHEIGHYLGLFHVRESGAPCASGTNDDPEGCSPFGSEDVLSDTDRTGPDARANVMFFQLRGDGNNTFSDGQGYVLRRHPLVR